MVIKALCCTQYLYSSQYQSFGMTDYKALHLPDLLKLFPWGWSKNPYLEEVGEECRFLTLS